MKGPDGQAERRTNRYITIEKNIQISITMEKNIQIDTSPWKRTKIDTSPWSVSIKCWKIPVYLSRSSDESPVDYLFSVPILCVFFYRDLSETGLFVWPISVAISKVQDSVRLIRRLVLKQNCPSLGIITNQEQRRVSTIYIAIINI
jgi:hypothetical protein